MSYPNVGKSFLRTLSVFSVFFFLFSFPAVGKAASDLSGFAWGSTVTGWLFFVGDATPPPTPATVTLLAKSPLDDAYIENPTYVPVGHPLNLTWTSTNAIECEASNTADDTVWLGSKPASGEVPSNPLNKLGLSEFNIICKDANYEGFVSDSFNSEVRCQDYGAPDITVEALDSTSIVTKILAVPSSSVEALRTSPESYKLYEVKDDLTLGGLISTVDVTSGAEVGMTIAEYGLTPNTTYCRRIQANHSVCGDTMSNYSCRTTPGTSSWSINAISCGEEVTGAPSFAECVLPKTETPEQGLAAHWKFDETSGFIANDSSGNGQTGTLVNGPSWVSTGKIGRALSFNGNTQRVAMGDILKFTAAQEATISLWFRADTFPTGMNQFLLGRMNTSGTRADYALVVQDATTVAYAYDDSVANEEVFFPWTVPSMTPGSWHHFVVVLNTGGMVRGYFDGVSLGTLSSALHDDFVSTQFYIAEGVIADYPSLAPNGTFKNFDGTIDDVRVYNRPLSSTEINTLYTRGAEPFVPPEPSPEVCGTTINTCLEGTLQDMADPYGYHYWKCDGINDGVGPTASGEIVGGNGYVAWDTTSTPDNNISCRLSLDPQGTNRTSSSADGYALFAISESQRVTITCTDSFNKQQQSKEAFCSVECNIEEGCLECGFSPANSPVEPVVGDYVHFTATINGGREPFSVEWRGDDLTYVTSSTWLRKQELNKIYSTVGPKAVSVEVKDDSFPQYTATCSLIADPNAPNAGPNLRVRGQIIEI